MSNVRIFVISILIPVVLGFLIGLITAPTGSYANLQKPFLAPPGWVFPVVWTILYVLMGVSYGLLNSKGLTDESINRSYYFQLIVNALWSIIFFNLEWRFFALLWIVLLIVLIINMIIKFYNKDKVAGLLQIPYLIWVLFATYLNYSFYVLNK